MLRSLIALKKRLSRESSPTSESLWRMHCNNLASYSSILLGLCPNHERCTCSDKRPKNVGRCARCTLLFAQRTGKWSPDMDLKMSIVTRVPKGKSVV